MVAFLAPFRIIDGTDSPTWAVSIDEINQRRWNYVALHELVGGLDVGLPAPYHMVVCRDGALGLPAIQGLRSDQQAVEFFNRCLAALLIGGVYSEALTLDGLDFGSIIDWKYLRVHTAASSATNRFHNLVRLRHASPYEAISLTGARPVAFDDLSAALSAGRSVLGALPELSPEFLLKGVTGIARRDWGAALANLWIVVEQITSNLWVRRVLTPAKGGAGIGGRSDQLSDPRTWTTAVRHELLHQIGVLPHETLARLSTARKARNGLAHEGKHPPATAAQSAYQAVLNLMTIAAAGLTVPLLNLDLDNHTLSDPFAPPKPMNLEPTHWMEIPKLPGEEELEKLEANRAHRQGRRTQSGPDG